MSGKEQQWARAFQHLVRSLNYKLRLEFATHATNIPQKKQKVKRIFKKSELLKNP